MLIRCHPLELRRDGHPLSCPTALHTALLTRPSFVATVLLIHLPILLSTITVAWSAPPSAARVWKGASSPWSAFDVGPPVLQACSMAKESRDLPFQCWVHQGLGFMVVPSKWTCHAAEARDNSSANVGIQNETRLNTLFSRWAYQLYD